MVRNENTLGLPVNYVSRWPPDYYDDASESVRLYTWQASVYATAHESMNALSADRLIDLGCGSGEKTMRIAPTRAIGLDIGSNLTRVKDRYPDGDWREYDADTGNALPVSEDELRAAVILAADVIEHLRNPSELLRVIRDALSIASVAIISTPDRALTAGSAHMGPPENQAHVREWTALELITLFRSIGFEHGVLTWMPAHDLSLSATTCVAFLTNRPDIIDRLQIVQAPMRGMGLSPSISNVAPSGITRTKTLIRRQYRRAVLRTRGRRIHLPQLSTTSATTGSGGVST